MDEIKFEENTKIGKLSLLTPLGRSKIIFCDPTQKCGNHIYPTIHSIVSIPQRMGLGKIIIEEFIKRYPSNKYGVVGPNYRSLSLLEKIQKLQNVEFYYDSNLVTKELVRKAMIQKTATSIKDNATLLKLDYEKNQNGLFAYVIDSDLDKVYGNVKSEHVIDSALMNCVRELKSVNLRQISVSANHKPCFNCVRSAFSLNIEQIHFIDNDKSYMITNLGDRVNHEYKTRIIALS